ncbi:MAG: TraR/DksA C4-type zinc finger protein [Gemmataceae bacterium]|nr:TraR/DksA C4-type zinc finger protein [Gemmataceae bacterium]MCI0740459.1 TraR/DksA C4-type zinc finger protein [Gemmataceae bacterium]
MNGRNALLRMHQALLARRERLCKKLAGELAFLHNSKAADAIGDSADLAFEADGDEMSSRLAELDDRELSQIELALARLKHGMYGICAGGSWNCQKKIPVARLNTLPYTPYCINCEREMEKHRGGLGRQTKGNWGRIADAQAPMQDQRLNLCQLEMELSGS